MICNAEEVGMRCIFELEGECTDSVLFGRPPTQKMRHFSEKIRRVKRYFGVDSCKSGTKDCSVFKAVEITETLATLTQNFLGCSSYSLEQLPCIFKLLFTGEYLQLSPGSGPLKIKFILYI